MRMRFTGTHAQFWGPTLLKEGDEVECSEETFNACTKLPYWEPAQKPAAKAKKKKAEKAEEE